MAREVSTWTVIVTALVCLGSIAAEAQDVEQMKAWVADAAIGEDVRVTLSDGEHLEGTLAGAEESRFGLWVEPDDAARARYGEIRSLKRWVDYVDVADLVVGGMPVEPSDGSLSFRLRFGDEARVRTSGGTTVKGKVTDFDGTSLRIEEQTFNLTDGDVQRIEIQQRDSLTNGALIGFGAGAAFVGIVCVQGCGAELAAFGALFYGAVGAGLGALIDSFNKSYTTVYVSSESETQLTLVPILTPDKKGVALSLSF